MDSYLRYIEMQHGYTSASRTRASRTGQRVLWLAVLLLLPLGGLSDVFGQTGSIQGQVVDATTQEALPGVNVLIAGTTRGAATT